MAEWRTTSGAGAAASFRSLPGNTAAEAWLGDPSGERGEAGAEDGVGEAGDDGDDISTRLCHGLTAQGSEARVRNDRNFKKHRCEGEQRGKEHLC
jgi:hypothetical protein